MDSERPDKNPEDLILDFIAESEVFITTLNKNFDILNDSVVNNKEFPKDEINEIFLIVHSINRMACSLKFDNICNLTHSLENLFYTVVDNNLPLTQDVMDVCWGVLNLLKDLIAKVKNEKNDNLDVSVQIQSLEKIRADYLEELGEEGLKEVKAEEQLKIDKYIEIFISDTAYNIEQFNENLLAFEEDSTNSDVINELFRIAHTVKGSAGIIARDDISKTAHKMEDILSLCRDGKIEVKEELISLLFKGIDKIKEILDLIIQGDKEPIEVFEIVAELDKLISTDQEESNEETPTIEEKEIIEPSNESLDLLDIDTLSKDEKEKLRAYIEEELDVFRLYFRVIRSVPMKSMKMLLIEEKLRKHGTIIKTTPDYEVLDKTVDKDVHCAILYVSVENEKVLKDILYVDGVEDTGIERLDAKAIAEELDGMIVDKGVAMSDPQEIKKEDVVPEKKGEQVVASSAGSIQVSTVRVDIRKLDSLMNLAGELVITKSRFAQLVNEFNREISVEKDMVQRCYEMELLIEKMKRDYRSIDLVNDENLSEKTLGELKNGIDDVHGFIDFLREYVFEDKRSISIHEFDETTSDLTKISNDIQSGVMQIRMVPVEGVFTRFRRTVRDLAKEMNKKVNLQIIGEDTELDKKLIDSLGEPLTHMIRNALGHGIETTEERIRAGKSDTATVILKASHEGNNVAIEVSDDGRGMDPDLIAEAAVGKGLITSHDLEILTEQEKLNFIFHPGFSTAKNVTDVCGRGVGLDVVKDMIKTVKGTISIETERGKGTKFVIKIPLTLAIIQALLIVVNDQTFAIPLEGVLEIIKVTQDVIYSVDGNNTVKLRDHALSLVDLFDVIKLQKCEELDKPGETWVSGETEESESVEVVPKPAMVRNSTDKKIVIISDGMQQIGLIVDSLIGEEEIVIKSLTDHFANVKGIGGASVLGDGRIALILDPISIIKEAS